MGHLISEEAERELARRFPCPPRPKMEIVDAMDKKMFMNCGFVYVMQDDYKPNVVAIECARMKQKDALDMAVKLFGISNVKIGTGYMSHRDGGYWLEDKRKSKAVRVWVFEKDGA